MKLPIIYFGDPILRKKGAIVPEITDEIRQLIDDMIETMDDVNGLGLAAPQVNRSLALFMTRVPIEGPDDTWTEGKLRVFINPKIIAYSEELWSCTEGCLSIPGLYEEVLRPMKVTVRATDVNGQEFVEEFMGLEAHAVMHENDHINGVLFIDRLPPKLRKEIEPFLRKIKKSK